MKFINIKEEDLMELASLFKEEFCKEPWNEPWSEETSYAHLKAIYDSYGFIGYKVYDDHHIGFILGNEEPSYMGTLFWIKEFCVFSTYQSMGYGKKILNEFEEKLHQQHIIGVLLWTNHETTSFYEKCGYKQDQDMLIMKKVLDV